MTKIGQDDQSGNGGGALGSVEDVFEKWLLTHDQKALRAVLSAVAAHYAGGEGVWLFIIDSPGSGKTEVIRSLGGLSDACTRAKDGGRTDALRALSKHDS